MLGFTGKETRTLTKVLPIGCSIPRTTLVHREDIIERYGFRLYVSMKDGSIVEDGWLICGKEIEPLMLGVEDKQALKEIIRWVKCVTSRRYGFTQVRG